jgi:hypothetical protein
MGVIATLALIFFLSDRKRDWMLSGIMASILICIKLDGLAFILFFALYALFSKEKRKYVIGAIILGIVVYIIPSILIAHNPLYTFENYGNYQASINSISAERNGLVFLVMLGLAVIQKGLSPTSYYQIYSLGIMLWLAILSTAFLIKHRRKELYLIAFLFWGFLAYMLFGTITLSHYSVEAFIPRYLIIVAAPFALLISYLIAGIYHTIKNRSNRYIAAAIFIFIILLLLLSLLSTYIIIYQYEMMIVQQTVPSNIPLP